MTNTPDFNFDDGAAYERYMGVWSQQAGEQFLQWLQAPQGLRWLDVGCGNGAFTELLAQRCAPAALHGIDPAEGQLAYARTRPVARRATFEVGDAMALPCPDDAFDAAVMPLVIFFVPQPELGVAEMVRVVRPGGWVTAYAWDLPNGGLPYFGLQEEMRALGLPVPMPPSAEVARTEALQALWSGAGLQQVATTRITVQRRFASFDDYWATVLGGPNVGRTLAALSAEQSTELQSRLKQRLCTPGQQAFTCTGVANAVRGRVVG